MRKKIFTILLALAASVGMMNAKVTWKSSNISDLYISGSSYSKEGVTLSANGEFIDAYWQDYGDESNSGLGFRAHATGGYTFSNTLGKNFTKIEMTLRGPGGWDMVNLGSGWSLFEDPGENEHVFVVTWTGNASTVDLVKDESDFFGDYVKSIVFYFEGDSEEPDPTYTIALQDGTDNADKVTLSATSAVEGATVTVTPDEEYGITDFKATYNTTEELSTSYNAATGAYSFTMPAADVTIEATIALKPVPEGNIFAGFTATAGAGGFDNEGSANLVDNKFTSDDWTKWCTNNDHKSIPTGESESCWWIDFEASAALSLTGYILTTGNDTGSEHGRNPKNWLLKAKLNADDAWTTIATVTDDVTMKDKSFKDYKFFVDKSGSYQYFRFEVFANQGANVMQLCELRLIGSEASEPVLVTAHTLQLHVNDAAMGSVAVTNLLGSDIIDNGDGTFTVPEGAEVTLLATPNEGYEFTGWKASSTICDFNECEFVALPTVDNPLTFDMYQEAAFMAEFAAVAPAPATDPIVITTTTGQSSYTQGSITVSVDEVGDSDGFYLNEDKSAYISNSGSSTISKIELVPGWFLNKHDQVRANGAEPNSSSEELITFLNVNSNEVTLSCPVAIYIKEVRIYFEEAAPADNSVKLYHNFYGEWAETEAFGIYDDYTSEYAKISMILEPGDYEFALKVGGELRGDGTAFSRDKQACILAEGFTANLTLNVDVKGTYRFYWFFEENRFGMDVPNVCGMYWKEVADGKFEVTLGKESEVTLPKVYTTNMGFATNIFNGVDQVRLVSTDETVATIEYTISTDGLGTITLHNAGECDIYAVHDITDYYCYDSVAFHLTVLPESTPEPTPTVTWNSSNVSNLQVVGNSYSKEGVTLGANASNNYAYWLDYGDESQNGIYFYVNATGGHTFSNSLGKNFTKIEMTLNGSTGWYVAYLGSGWNIDGLKVIWTGNASTVDLLTETSSFGGAAGVKSIVFYFEGGSEPEPAPTVWTALEVGDVIKLGDKIEVPAEGDGWGINGNILRNEWGPYTLIRADIVQEHDYDDPEVTETEDGAYYVFKAENDDFYPLSNLGKGTGLVVTGTSDGLVVTNVGDLGMPVFTVAVHDNGGATAIDEISQGQTCKSQKLIKNGQILIIRDGKTYTVTGQQVR